MREGLLFFAWEEFCCYKWIQRWIRGMAMGGGVLQEQRQWYHTLPATSNCAQIGVENTHWSYWSHLVKKVPHAHTSHWMNQITLEQIKKAGILSPKPLLVTYIFAQKASAPQIAPTSTSHPSYQQSVTPHPELAITVPGSSSLPHTSVSRATKWNPALSCTNWGWKYFLMPKINLNTFQCSS